MWSAAGIPRRVEIQTICESLGKLLACLLWSRAHSASVTRPPLVLASVTRPPPNPVRAEPHAACGGGVLRRSWVLQLAGNTGG